MCEMFLVVVLLLNAILTFVFLKKKISIDYYITYTVYEEIQFPFIV
jgi:regulatory protein YycI of two-component signal transduction system YycFG